MQAAGRAGRDAAQASASEMWVQTWHPQHPLFAALKRHDFPAFAEQQLKERQQAAMPPFAFQAVLRAEARTQEVAQQFLQAAAAVSAELNGSGHVVVYAPVPMTVQRVANVERAQLLLESGSRPALQAFLAAWQPELQVRRPRGLIRWAVDVDPLVI
jgi:primosomal protein N' (replication factor Y)